MSAPAEPRPFRRSRKWLQELVCNHPAKLAVAIRANSPAVQATTIDWRSPRAPKYLEYRDGKALRALDLEHLERTLASFWPARGPVWDALGVGLGTDERFLVEAKAHIPELVSSPTGAQGSSLRQIRRRLTDLKRSLRSGAPADWTGPFYQYANRLAYLDWLRAQGTPAFLVSVYFVNAPDVPEPVSKPQWEGALRVLCSYLGLGRHRLKPYIVDVFFDVLQLAG